MNFKLQFYQGIPLRPIKRNYKHTKAKRFLINDTKQNVWISNKHLEHDGRLSKIKTSIIYSGKPKDS